MPGVGVSRASARGARMVPVCTGVGVGCGVIPLAFAVVHLVIAALDSAAARSAPRRA